MKKILASVFAGMILLLSCPGPQPVVEDPVPTAQPAAPGVPRNVVVKLRGDAVKITWDSVPGAESYQVYRKAGDTGFTLLYGNGITSAASEDTGFPVDKTLQYAVKSVQGSRFSEMSEPSNTVSVFVQNLQASKLSFNDRIELMWLPVHDPELETYIVYRYTKVNAAAPEMTCQQTGNIYVDTTETVVANTPYFYKVTWKKNSIEYGVDAPFVLGVFSTAVDSYEPNEDYTDLAAGKTSAFYDWNLTADWSRAPAVFSFSDGSEGTETDTDWYKYRGIPSSAIGVEIQLPANTPFNTAESRLYFQFYYAGNYYPAQPVVPNMVNHITSPFEFSSFSDYNNTEQELYFRIFPVVSSSTNVCGKYKVNLINEGF